MVLKTNITITPPSYKAWLSAAALSCGFVVLVLLPFWLLPKGLSWLLALLLLLPLIPVFESLLLTPLYRLSGRFVYYSNTLFVTRIGNRLQLHAGTLYDYMRLLRRHEYGPKAQRKLTVQLLQGLLVICDDIADGKFKDDTPISATSYFFSDRSAVKLGFISASVEPIERLNLLLSSISLAIRLSISKGRLSWPNVKHIRHIHTTAGKLVEQRATIVRLLRHLNSKH